MLTRFRRFRRSRPFWAGLFTVLGGIEILLLPLSPVADMVLLGVAGMSGALIGVLLVVTGLFVWYSPPNRNLAGVLTLVFSLASFVVTNLGGLIVGMVLGLIGGGLTLAWTPDKATGGGRGRRGGGRGGRGGGTVAALVLLLAPVVLMAQGAAPAEASPHVGPAPGLPLPPVPDPNGDDPDGSGGGRSPTGPPLALLLPGMPAPLLPPVLPRLARLIPPVLTAPLQPKVAAGDRAVASGLVGDLRMDTLTVTNFRYQGIIEFPVAGGGRQRAMHILLDSTDIGNLRIVIPGRTGSKRVVQRAGAEHSRTTALVLDCTRLKLNLFGVLPIEFTLDFPPPPLIPIPYLSATDVEIDYVRLVTPSLIIPGAQAHAAGPAGQRTGVTGAAGGGAAGGQRLTAGQADQLTRFAALLKRPELMRPYRPSAP